MIMKYVQLQVPFCVCAFFFYLFRMSGGGRGGGFVRNLVMEREKERGRPKKLVYPAGRVFLENEDFDFVFEGKFA